MCAKGVYEPDLSGKGLYALAQRLTVMKGAQFQYNYDYALRAVALLQKRIQEHERGKGGFYR